MRPATRSTSLASMTDVDMSEPVSGKGERTRKASTTVSTRSTRRTASPSRSSKQDDAGPPTPESPPFRLTRKRAASLAADHKGGDDDDGGGSSSNNKDEADDVVEAITPSSTTHSRMSSGGASAGSAGSAASHVCLCQPDPKIPRPRNGQLSSTLSLCCFPCCLHYLIFSLKKNKIRCRHKLVFLSMPLRSGFFPSFISVFVVTGRLTAFIPNSFHTISAAPPGGDRGSAPRASQP